jgi:ABC-2 type transport system permease protein
MGVFKELYAYRQMLVSLVRRDLRGRYKGSFLGFLWTFINPLLQLAIYTVVFSFILRANIEKFYLFLFVALVPWIFFSASLNGGAGCVLAHKDMVKKIYFPREVLPIAYVTSCFVNMLFSFLIIFAVIIVSGTPLNLLALCFLPIVMLVEFILALGIALLSSAITVFFRDLEHILGIVSMAWMYLTPIMYNITIVPQKLLPVFMANPMTPIVMAYRDILYYARIPSLQTLLHALALGLLVLALGFWVFGKLKYRFVEEI